MSNRFHELRKLLGSSAVLEGMVLSLNQSSPMIQVSQRAGGNLSGPSAIRSGSIVHCKIKHITCNENIEGLKARNRIGMEG